MRDQLGNVLLEAREHLSTRQRPCPYRGHGRCPYQRRYPPSGASGLRLIETSRRLPIFDVMRMLRPLGLDERPMLRPVHRDDEIAGREVELRDLKRQPKVIDASDSAPAKRIQSKQAHGPRAQRRGGRLQRARQRMPAQTCAPGMVIEQLFAESAPAVVLGTKEQDSVQSRTRRF
jgi:hypothetical protein